MDEPIALQRNSNWRIAVWALRIGFCAVATMVAGIIVLSSGGTPWVLAVGVMVWVVCAAVTLVEVFRTRHALPEPRPGLWPMRWMIVHDAVGLKDRTPTSH
jgi:hypothetical protein